MNSFIDWLEGYLEDKLHEKQLTKIKEKYNKIEYEKFKKNNNFKDVNVHPNDLDIDKEEALKNWKNRIRNTPLKFEPLPETDKDYYCNSKKKKKRKNRYLSLYT